MVKGPSPTTKKGGLGNVKTSPTGKGSSLGAVNKPPSKR